MDRGQLTSLAGLATSLNAGTAILRMVGFETWGGFALYVVDIVGCWLINCLGCKVLAKVKAILRKKGHSASSDISEH